jgi:two-component system, chemotaxis family, CheB/CheR fusion protein
MKFNFADQLWRILNELPVAIYVKDIGDDFRYIFWNKQAHAIWALSDKEVMGKTDRDIFPAEIAAFLHEKDVESAEKRQVVYLPEEAVESPKGEKIWLRTWRHVVCDTEGKPKFLIACSQDITQMKNAIDEAHLQKQQLQSISNNAPGILFQFRVTPENHMSFTYIGGKFKDVFGIDPQEIMGRAEHMFELLHPDDRADFFDTMEDTIRQRRTWNWQGRMVNAQGKVLHIETHSNPYVSENNCTYWDGMFQDITKLKEKERLLRDQSEKMHQAARMISIGEMAGGVAHEINTPLGAIGILSEMAICEVEKTDGKKEKVLQSIQQINDMVFRISKIIKAMRSYARKDSDDHHQSTSVHSIVEEVLSVCSHRMKYDQIRVDLSGLPRDLYLICNPVQISQILLNLINNSCDAIKDKDEKWIKIALHQKGRQHLELSVTDSGNGIPLDVAKHLFENFFTTKGPKEGTGLGLSLSKNIMKLHGGDLLMDPESPNTRFILRFPLAKTQAA